MIKLAVTAGSEDPEFSLSYSPIGSGCWGTSEILHSPCVYKPLLKSIMFCWRLKGSSSSPLSPSLLTSCYCRVLTSQYKVPWDESYSGKKLSWKTVNCVEIAHLWLLSYFHYNTITKYLQIFFQCWFKNTKNQDVFVVFLIPLK